MAPEKAEALIFQTRSRRRQIETVPPRAVKCHGICHDNNFIVGEQVQKTEKRAERTLAAILGPTQNVGGSGYALSVMQYGIVQSIVLFGASVWSAALKVKTSRESCCHFIGGVL